MTEPVRKRHRISKACEFCRRRKVKCNLEQPCATCLKYDNDKCIYESKMQQLAKSKDEGGLEGSVMKELNSLREKLQTLESAWVYGESKPVQRVSYEATAMKVNSVASSRIHPVRSGDDVLDFYTADVSQLMTMPSRRAPLGPMSWLRLIKSDVVLKYLVDHLMTMKKKLARNLHGMPHEFTTSKGHALKRWDDQAYNFTRLADELKERKKAQSIAKSQINDKAKSLGFMFYHGELDNELELIQKIELILPTKKVIWLLLDRFFSQLYPFFPLIDQSSFYSHIQRLLGQKTYDDERVSTIKVESRLDFAFLGTLLIILRMSNLTLFSAITEPAAEKSELNKDAFLLNNPINLEAIDISMLCLKQFDLTKNITLPIFQFALFSRVYHAYAPEIGDNVEGYEAQALTAILVSMANSMGLNRDPESINGREDLKKNNLMRKIWYTLVFMDVGSLLSIGATSPCIHPEFYDTKPPFYEFGNENVYDPQLERMAITGFQQKIELMSHLYGLSASIMRLGTTTKMVDLCQKLDKVEAILNSYSKFKVDPKSLSDLTARDLFLLINEFKDYNEAKLAMTAVYYYIFNYYEEKEDYEMMSYYVDKIFKIMGLELLPFFVGLIKNKNYSFKESIDLYMAPGFQSLCHSCLRISTSIEFRLKLTMRNLQNLDKEVSNFENAKMVYKHTLNMFEKLHKVCMVCNSKLTNRYYYAWRVAHFHSFMTEHIKEQELAESYVQLKSYRGFDLECCRKLTSTLHSSLLQIKQLGTVYSNILFDSERSPYASMNDPSPGDTVKSAAEPLSNLEVESDYPKVTDLWRNSETDELWLQMMKIRKMNNNALAEINNMSPANQNTRDGPSNNAADVRDLTPNSNSPTAYNLPVDYVSDDLFDSVIFDQILNNYN